MLYYRQIIMFKVFIETYSRLLTTKPLPTKMASTFTLMAAGDFTCQWLEKKVFEWDKERTLRQGLAAGLLVSPQLHFMLTRVMTKPWTYLPREHAIFKSRELTYRVFNALFRGILHTVVAMPWNLCIFTFTVRTVKNRSVEKGIQELKETYFTTLAMGFCYWPLINSSVYLKVFPLKFGNLYIDFFQYGWSIILSQLTNSKL